MEYALWKTFYYHLMWISWAEAFGTMPFLNFTHSSIHPLSLSVRHCTIYLSVGSFFCRSLYPQLLLFSMMCPSVWMCNKITMQRIGVMAMIFVGLLATYERLHGVAGVVDIVVVAVSSSFLTSKSKCQKPTIRYFINYSEGNFDWSRLESITANKMCSNSIVVLFQKAERSGTFYIIISMTSTQMDTRAPRSKTLKFHAQKNHNGENLC